MYVFNWQKKLKSKKKIIIAHAEQMMIKKYSLILLIILYKNEMKIILSLLLNYTKQKIETRKMRNIYNKNKYTKLHFHSIILNFQAKVACIIEWLENKGKKFIYRNL